MDTMKCNIFLSAISLLFALLVGYLIFNIAEGKNNDVLFGIGGTGCFLSTLLPAIGFQYSSARIGTNIRVLSTVFFLLFLAIHLVVAVFDIKIPYYIILNGVLLVVDILLCYNIVGTKM